MVLGRLVLRPVEQFDAALSADEAESLTESWAAKPLRSLPVAHKADTAAPPSRARD